MFSINYQKQKKIRNLLLPLPPSENEESEQKFGDLQGQAVGKKCIPSHVTDTWTKLEFLPESTQSEHYYALTEGSI